MALPAIMNLSYSFSPSTSEFSFSLSTSLFVRCACLHEVDDANRSTSREHCLEIRGWSAPIYGAVSPSPSRRGCLIFARSSSLFRLRASISGRIVSVTRAHASSCTQFVLFDGGTRRSTALWISLLSPRFFPPLKTFFFHPLLFSFCRLLSMVAERIAMPSLGVTQILHVEQFLAPVLYPCVSEVQGWSTRIL